MLWPKVPIFEGQDSPFEGLQFRGPPEVPGLFAIGARFGPCSVIREVCVQNFLTDPSEKSKRLRDQVCFWNDSFFEHPRSQDR